MRKRFHDKIMDEDNIDTSLNLSTSDNFCIQSSYVIIDEKTRSSLRKITLQAQFFFLDRSLSSDEILSKANE